MKIFRSLLLALTIYGFAGWVYIALCAVVHPETLSLQLTHVTPFIREDSFGILCFGVSFLSFFLWQATKPSAPPDHRGK